MKKQSRFDDCGRTTGLEVSRRAAIGSFGLATLCGLSGSVSGRETDRPGPPKEIQERMEQSRAFSERMRNASGPEEMRKIIEERSAWERNRAIEDLKKQLDITDQEWPVIRPRVEAVYNLVHPQNQFGRADARPTSPLEQKKSELRELLRNKEATADQIKTGLTALRAAREKVNQEFVKAKQDLRRIMTLRQEAVLALNGLLDRPHYRRAHPLRPALRVRPLPHVIDERRPRAAMPADRSGHVESPTAAGPIPSRQSSQEYGSLHVRPERKTL